MLDRDGYRPNVGIILLNSRNQVFWGKRLRTHSWQFPQGGAEKRYSLRENVVRELKEELGIPRRATGEIHLDGVEVLGGPARLLGVAIDVALTGLLLLPELRALDALLRQVAEATFELVF